jgi:CHAT domain-containing protein
LVRGLLYAGGRSVLTTLWELKSETWAEFAEAFYPLIHKGDSAEDALHSAVTSLRERNADPLKWAAFALFGDAR